jgi:hypothetical protein
VWKVRCFPALLLPLPIISPHRHLLPEASKLRRLQLLPLFPALFNAATLEATPISPPQNSNCIVTATSPFHNAKLSSGIGPSTISALLSKVSPNQAGIIRNSKPVTKMRESHVGEGGSVWIDMESRCMLATPIQPKFVSECLFSLLNSEHFPCFVVDSV